MGICLSCGKPTLPNYKYCMQCKGENPEKKQNISNPPAQNRQESHFTGFGSAYLKNGYFKDGYLRKEIFTDEAVKVAEKLAEKGMSKAALRRFYNKLRGIYARYKDTRNFEEIKPALYSFYPNATDATMRNNNNVPYEFRHFININVALAEKDPEHLKGFVEHFQSVLAYFKESGN